MLNSDIPSYRPSDYQRENFDRFIEKEKFVFNIPSIHVTGTNGKGSTCHYLNNIYFHNGYKVGLFISPSLSDVNHMIFVNNNPINDQEIIYYLKKYEKQFKKYQLSSFEIETFIALNYFIDQGCDITVIECGLGGLIDATNIIIPSLSIITSISLEHVDYLGYSLSEVAEHKGGIIKPNVPVLINEFEEDALNTIIKISKDNNAKVHYIARFIDQYLEKDGMHFVYHPYGEMVLQSYAKYEVTNAAFALEATNILQEQFPITIDKVKQGLGDTFIECRFQTFSNIPNLIVDGGHNAEALKALKEAVISYNQNLKPVHTVLANFKDKNLIGILNEIGVVSDEIIFTTFDHERARGIDDYFLFLNDYSFEENYVELINRLINQYPNDIILVTGSLAFASLVLENIKKGIIHYDSINQDEIK